jgi:hypothetical protein
MLRSSPLSIKLKARYQRGALVKNSTLKWELVGIVFIVVIGGALHFVFDLSGGWHPLALIAAVNESVWEHLKLGFWPAMVYFFIEHRYINKSSNNFLFAKAIGIFLIPVTITVLFYTYTAIIKDILAADLIIFVMAVVIGQLTSYKMLKVSPLPSWVNRLGLVLLILLTIAFGTLTYYAPQLPVFRDPISGGYGIQ